MYQNQRRDVYAQVTEQIIAQLELGVCPWHKPWRTSLPMNLKTGKPYRGINSILLSCVRMPSPYWLTLKQANGLGGSITKGSHGMPITFWSTYLRKNRNDDTGEETSRKAGFFRVYTVFNLSQTTGIAEKLGLDKPAEVVADIEASESIITEMKNPPKFVDSDSAWYRNQTDELGMPLKARFENIEEFYATKFHELVHSTMHPTRLNLREVDTRSSFGSPGYAEEELRAEIGANYLCSQVGIMTKTVENSAAYLQHWIRVLKGDSKLIMKTASAAQRAVDHIVGTPAYVEPEEPQAPAAAEEEEVAVCA
jgi:antirestriction protein ArdC